MATCLTSISTSFAAPLVGSTGDRRPMRRASTSLRSITGRFGDEDIALDHYKEFAQYLREELEGDEWRLPTSDISADTWSRDIDIADETPSPEDVDITTVDFEEMSFAVERALCEKHDISVHQSVDDRREKLETARETVRAATDDSEESPTDTGGFKFPAASQ